MQGIKIILFDVDGVITDGKKYVDGKGEEIKTLALKDLDAFSLLKQSGYKLGCITGEDTAFSKQFKKMQVLDYVKIGCKQKIEALREIKDIFEIESQEICYIGDGKYDIPILKEVGMAVCPKDAIQEVQKICNVILNRNAGEGCIAELYSVLSYKDNKAVEKKMTQALRPVIKNRMEEHQNVMKELLDDVVYMERVDVAITMIVNSYKKNGRLFLCGNGGSAADAQHLAAELVGRFYLERRALCAEALTVNTSVITSLANDYEYNCVFERQLEAKASVGDVLIGITTSGISENIYRAFKRAKKMGMFTILMTGEVSEYIPIVEYADCILRVPSKVTPRIQEMHILTGHIICEIVEREMVN